MWTEGGFPPTIPPTGHRGDHPLRPHPPGESLSVAVVKPSLSTLSRFRKQGNKQRKRNRNGLLWSAQYNRSIAVTNRVV